MSSSDDGGLIVDLIVWFLTTVKGLVTLAALLALAGFLGFNFEYGTQHTVTFTVNGLDDQGVNGGHQYMVFATRADGQTEVFKNTDAFWHGKHDSSDVWARFIVAGKGATWKCPVYGFRLFFGSHYRDILDGCVLEHSPGQSQTTSPGVTTPTGHDPLSIGRTYPVSHDLVA